jgi:hypothetical protein
MKAVRSVRSGTLFVDESLSVELSTAAVPSSIQREGNEGKKRKGFVEKRAHVELSQQPVYGSRSRDQARCEVDESGEEESDVAKLGRANFGGVADLGSPHSSQQPRYSVADRRVAMSGLERYLIVGTTSVIRRQYAR